MKIPLSLQRKYVFDRLGKKDPRVIIGSGLGEDAGVVAVGDAYLVSHTDPITEAKSHIGKIAVQVSSNDVAVKGAKPEWSLVTILLPHLEEALLDWITAEIDATSKRLGISIVGGHTEVAFSVNAPIVSISTFGIAKGSLLDVKRIRPGQTIIMVNEAGIEGTAVIALDHGDMIPDLADVVERSKRFIDELSVAEDALAASQLGAVSAHDPTEGGVIAGLLEMALSSHTMFNVNVEKIAIRKETEAICQKLGLDPLKLLSSGALLLTAEPDNAGRILDAFRGRARVIGRVEEGEGLLLEGKGYGGLISEIP
ncbi:MAG: AIR synthase-related protein, partial [TACK group archaeon]|nr:AIR synthase-related protein [TACK group archaeon]